MRFFAPKSENSKTEAAQLSNVNFDKSYDEPNESEFLDSDWVQPNESDNFNNYTEEY